MTAPAARRPRPLDIIGYRKDGRPIRLIAGGGGTGDPAPTGTTSLGAGGAAAPIVPATPPTPAPSTTFDPNTLSPEVAAYLASERARIAAEEGAKARTTSKANAAAEAKAELLKQLGLTAEKPEDAAAQLETERRERRAEQVATRVERLASKAGADDDLMVAYLQRQGRLKDLDPTAADFSTKVQALVDAALTEKPSLRLAGTAPAVPAVVPPGGTGPGSTALPGATPPPVVRSANYQEALKKHYAKPTQ